MLLLEIFQNQATMIRGNRHGIGSLQEQQKIVLKILLQLLLKLMMKILILIFLEMAQSLIMMVKLFVSLEV